MERITKDFVMNEVEAERLRRVACCCATGTSVSIRLVHQVANCAGQSSHIIPKRYLWQFFYMELFTFVVVGASASVQHSHHSDRTREYGTGREGEEGKRKCQQGTSSGYQGSYHSQAASKAQERHSCFGKSQEKEVMGLTFGVVMCIW